MSTLYVASTETFVGKSATCVGLLERARRDGLSIGYMKPVSVSVTPTEAGAIDEDARFIKEHFNLSDPLDRIAPVLLTQGVVEQMMRGQVLEIAPSNAVMAVKVLPSCMVLPENWRLINPNR